MTVWWLWLAASLTWLLEPSLPLRGRRAQLLTVSVVLALACLAPFVLPQYRVSQLTRMWTLAVACVGLNLLSGYGGQLSLGQGAFMLMGAYTTAILADTTRQLGPIDASPWPFWAILPVAGLVAMGAGLCLGAIALRWHGVFLALGTFIASLVLPQVLLRYESFSGGVRGLRFPAVPPPSFLRTWLQTYEWHYFVSLLVLVVGLVLAWNLVRGSWGRALVAVRDSELGARASGVDVVRVKIAAFALSALYGGVAGALYVVPLRFVMPETIEPLESVFLFLALMVGGMGHLGGAILAAALLTYLPTDLVQAVGKVPGLGVDVVSRGPGLIQGAIVVITMMTMPRGVMYTLEGLRASWPNTKRSLLARVPSRIYGVLRVTRVWAGQGGGNNTDDGGGAG